MTLTRSMGDNMQRKLTKMDLTVQNEMLMATAVEQWKQKMQAKAELESLKRELNNQKKGI